jgi:hypothetical protein
MMFIAGLTGEEGLRSLILALRAEFRLYEMYSHLFII